MVSLANRCDIPVAAGAQHPLFQKLITAEFWHGKNGLANVELPASKCKVDPHFGPDLIIQMVHAAPHEITLVPVGPLTNIALAVCKDPSIVPLVKEVIIMGGSITGGNVNAAAEANIYNDPEAAQIVFQAGWPLTMVGSGCRRQNSVLAEISRSTGPDSWARSMTSSTQVGKYLVDLSRSSDRLVRRCMILSRSASPSMPPWSRRRKCTSTSRPEASLPAAKPSAIAAGYVERNVLHGDHYVIEGIDKVTPNAKFASMSTPTDSCSSLFPEFAENSVRGLFVCRL